MADRQQLNIGIQPPFTNIHYVKSNRISDQNTQFFNGWLHGFVPQYNLKPYSDFTVDNSSNSIIFFQDFGKRPDSFRVTINEVTAQIWLKENTIAITHIFGTDELGRDIFSRLIIGARVSLMVGAFSVLVAICIGVLTGALGGYFGGWVDKLVMWAINTFWSVPTVLLVIFVTIASGKGLLPIVLAIGLSMWVEVARIVRGEIKSLKKTEFAEAGKALGYKPLRILFVHLLPNTFGSIVVVAIANFAAAILIESGISFLGLGLQPPTPTWGNMIDAARPYLITGKAFLLFLPCLAILLSVLSFTLLSNSLRRYMG